MNGLEVSARNNAAVVGGGPAGLAAALELERRGFRVTVFEKREALELRTRLRWQVVGVDELALAALRELGVDHASLMTPIRSVLVDGGPSVGVRCIAEPSPERSRPAPSSLQALQGRRTPLALVGIGELERELAALAAGRPGIDVVYSAQILELSVRRDRVTVAWRRAGEQRVSSSFDYAVVADGAHSSARGALALLGVPRKRASSETTLLLAGFAPTVRTSDLVFRYVPGAPLSDVLIMGLRHRTAVMTNDLRPEEGGRDLVGAFRRLAHSLGWKEDLVEGPLRFTTGVSYSERLELEGRLFVIGDAAFAGTPLLGIHLNKAVLEARSVAELVAQVARVSPEQGRRLVERHERERRRFYQGLVLEEALVARLHHHPVGPLRALPGFEQASALALRSLLRARFGWLELPAAGLLTALDALRTASAGALHSNGR